MNKTGGLLFASALLVAAAGGLSSQTNAAGWAPSVAAKGEIADAASPPIRPAACVTVLGQRICVEDDRDGGNGKGKEESAGNPGERSCPPGYVVLDKANKYGAFCEPKEGFPGSAPQPAPQEAKCQFPGEVGTPPNCQCPADTTFYGYQGCMKTCCGTPSQDPNYKQVYMQCHKDDATAHQLAVALAKANGDAGANVTCEVTRNYPK